MKYLFGNLSDVISVSEQFLSSLQPDGDSGMPGVVKVAASFIQHSEAMKSIFNLYCLNHDKAERIQVEGGKILRLEFTTFAVRICTNINECPCSHVKITDGDGTTLMDNSCGYSDPSSSYYFLPPIITTRSNRVEIFFHTDGSGTRAGWSLSWSAVTPGEKALMLNSIKISHHSPSLKMMISSLQYDWITHQTSS